MLTVHGYRCSRCVNAFSEGISSLDYPTRKDLFEKYSLTDLVCYRGDNDYIFGAYSPSLAKWFGFYYNNKEDCQHLELLRESDPEYKKMSDSAIMIKHNKKYLTNIPLPRSLYEDLSEVYYATNGRICYGCNRHRKYGRRD